MGSHSHARKRVRHQVSAVTSSVAPSLLPDIPGSSVLMSGPSRGLVTRGHFLHLKGETGDQSRRLVTIDILPDEVLLELFDIYITDEYVYIHRWHTLVQVCRRWRSVVFASTHRLNVQLQCTYKTPVREMLGIWPSLPIVIKNSLRRSRGSQPRDADNIVAALGHRDRVCRIELEEIAKPHLKRFAAAMMEPFPELTHLNLETIKRNTLLLLPDSFLGGTAPRLRMLRLRGISFPAMPKLLSSASDLVQLFLLKIPHSGYISPEAMVTCLSALTRLEGLSIGLQSPRSRPDQPSAPRLIHTVLPALTSFKFRGVSEYLEDFISRIDAPLLSDFHISFFNQLIFNTPRLCSFISHAVKLRSQSQAQMTFYSDLVVFSLTTAGGPGLNLAIICRALDWQLSSLVQICDPSFLSLFNLERLEIRSALKFHPGPNWQEVVETTQLPELLHPFTTVKSLSLSKEFTPLVMPALQELSGGRTMEVLPALQSIFLKESSLSGPVKEAVLQFVTARQLSGHPVAVNPQGQE